MLKLRTSFSSASEPIFFRKERLTLGGATFAAPVELYWLFDLILLSFIIKYIIQRSSHRYGQQQALFGLTAKRLASMRISEVVNSLIVEEVSFLLFLSETFAPKSRTDSKIPSAVLAETSLKS